MAFFDLLILFFLTMIVGSVVGIGFGMLSMLLLKMQDNRKLLKIIQGKIPNKIKLDNKMVDVNKFTYKEDDGEIIKKVTLADIVKKSSPEPLKEEKTPIKKRKKVFFWKRKEEKK